MSPKTDPNKLEIKDKINLISVGTQNLLATAMDQYLRTLGDIDTYYAPTMKVALRTLSEQQIHLLLSEVDLGDGSCLRLLKQLSPTVPTVIDDLFRTLVVSENREAETALAAELEAHHVLVKPINAAGLKDLIQRYQSWRIRKKEPWEECIRNAHHCVREKKFREAESNYVEALKLAPDNPVPVFKAGMYYLQKPDPGIAERFFKMALDIRPNYVVAISALGSLYLSLGDLDRAETELRRAQELSPLNPDRLLELMKVYLFRCMEACKRSLRLDSANTLAHYVLGKLFAVQKDYASSIRELDQALPHVKEELKKETEVFLALSRKLGGIAK